MSHESEIRDVIEIAVETEKLGSAFYDKMARAFNDEKEVNELFSTLAGDERVHEQMFRILLAELPDVGDLRKKTESIAFIKAMILPDLLLGDEDARDRLMEFQTSEDALFRALRLEKDTLEYYEAMRELFGEHRALDKIIAEEKTHITKLMAYLIIDAKMRGLSDRYPGDYRA